MNNDLISREYVKLFVCEYEKFNGKKTEIVKAVPLIAIDNAPTVERENVIGEVVSFVEKDTRPHGEWEDYSEEGFVECPFCHKATNCEDNIDELHYCWNCGARLGKGGIKE